jgi:hypothetical protein
MPERPTASLKRQRASTPSTVRPATPGCFPRRPPEDLAGGGFSGSQIDLGERAGRACLYEQLPAVGDWRRDLNTDVAWQVRTLRDPHALAWLEHDVATLSGRHRSLHT